MLLNRRLVRCVMRYLVLWRGHTSADDELLRAEELTHCQEQVAEHTATAPQRRAARRAEPAAAPPAPPVRLLRRPLLRSRPRLFARGALRPRIRVGGGALAARRGLG